jgi:putative glycerol-1-phosphate prenyltransferase
MIREVKNNIQVPLIVGGGINTAEKLYDAFSSGADLVVIGNVLESSPEKIVLFKEIQNQFNAV